MRLYKLNNSLNYSGPLGPAGSNGKKGSKGDRGNVGSTGRTGPRGNSGPPGRRGSVYVVKFCIKNYEIRSIKIIFLFTVDL